jgi:quinol monooxygenase YgiN
MMIVHVEVTVKPEAVAAFEAATIVNATASRKEAGVARFDILCHRDDPTRFVLVEIYRTEQAALAHKATSHYAVWRDTVAPMMAAPRLLPTAIEKSARASSMKGNPIALTPKELQAILEEAL